MGKLCLEGYTTFSTVILVLWFCKVLNLYGGQIYKQIRRTGEHIHWILWFKINMMYLSLYFNYRVSFLLYRSVGHQLNCSEKMTNTQRWVILGVKHQRADASLPSWCSPIFFKENILISKNPPAPRHLIPCTYMHTTLAKNYGISVWQTLGPQWMLVD